jgi:hypothetical protein
MVLLGLPMSMVVFMLAMRVFMRMVMMVIMLFFVRLGT